MSSAQEFATKLDAFMRQNGINVPPPGLDLCRRHYEVLLRWNRVMNLVGDLSFQTAIRRHYGESLWLASVAGDQSGVVCDFGAGPGFPGIGFCALWPHAHVILAEAREKRAAFLHEAFRGLSKVVVHTGDAFAVAGSVNLVCGRAVSPELILKFARTRSASIGLLLSRQDAERIIFHESMGELRKEIHPVPWRDDSVAFCAFRQ